MAVEGTPSSSCSSRIFLSATISPVSLFLERYYALSSAWDGGTYHDAVSSLADLL